MLFFLSGEERNLRKEILEREKRLGEVCSKPYNPENLKILKRIQKRGEEFRIKANNFGNSFLDKRAKKLSQQAGEIAAMVITLWSVKKKYIVPHEKS